ncbi:hypothetical protein [Ramlibacter tataouinensis]|nr:hypothetical protein [Ramlibacter tataouinensis]
MRPWLLILMVALLPLRGWVGDAMAGEALARQVVAMAADAQASAPHPPDCHGHAAASSDAGDVSAPDLHAGEVCSHCQLCMLLALRAPEGGFTAVRPVHALPAFGADRYASAPLPPLLKPPIS